MRNAKILFIAGNEGSGKTPTCKEIENLLKQKSYSVKRKEDFPGSQEDFLIHLEKEATNIIVCTASDSKFIISQLIHFLEELIKEFKECDELILILAARNEGDEMRSYLENEIFQIIHSKATIEIPLARINDNSKQNLKDWYYKSINELVKNVLENNPFNII